MATTVTFNGANYTVPAYGDTGWAQGAGNLSSYLIAISTGTLQTTGGTFTLSADANFGTSYGLIGIHKSTSANIAAAGVLRLADGDAVNWRNHANSADVSLAKNTSDQLTWGGQIVVTSSSGQTPVEHRVTYTAGTASGSYTGSLTVVGLNFSYVQNGVNLRFYLNGLLLAPTLDYAETSTTSVTLNTACNTGDRIDALATTY